VPKLSVIVITKNEAANIGAALDSVAWADEIVVVDAGSTDDTAAIARAHGARVEVRPWPGYAAQKNYAASIASHDWLLSLDADERVTPELATEIRALMATAGDPPARGYRMPRVTYAFDRWIRTTDWYPDRQLRLYDRRVGRWNETKRVHESVTLAPQEDANGRARNERVSAGSGAGSGAGTSARLEVGELRAELQHLGYHGIAHHLGTINRYTTLAAEDMSAQGRRAGTGALLVHGPAAFLRNYLLRGGWRDGSVGLVISLMNAYYVLLKHIKLWELQRRFPRTAPPIEPRP
jgi:glycosyltransferase involved in cell wall biosynthesis